MEDGPARIFWPMLHHSSQPSRMVYVVTSTANGCFWNRDIGDRVVEEPVDYVSLKRDGEHEHQSEATV